MSALLLSGVCHDDILLLLSSSSLLLFLSQLRGGDNGGEAVVEFLDEGAGVVRGDGLEGGLDVVVDGAEVEDIEEDRRSSSRRLRLRR